MAMTSGFASLVPAFSISLQATAQLALLSPGQLSPGAFASVGPISTGTITSEPGFIQEPLNGTFVNGADVIRIDPMGKAAVLDFRSVIMLSETENIFFTFTGFIEGNNETLPFLAGNPDATGYDFGSAFVSGFFETEFENYGFLTNKIFVGSQRIVEVPEKPVAVEIKLSQVGLQG